MHSKQVKRVTFKHYAVPIPVYDCTVPGTENFVLANGCVVHNSKDVADSVAGVAHILKTKEAKTGGSTSARRRSRVANARTAGETEPAKEDNNNQRRVRRLRLRRRV